MLKKGLVFGILVLFISTTFATSINVNITKLSGDRDAEYWALLVAVGVYAGHPDQDRPSMLREVENLHDMLLVSEHWKEDHIKVIKGENATVWNIFKGLRWLDKMDDKDDFSLVYITTHGGQLSKDIWPWDEKDGCDELLVSYLGFQFPWAIIWDDLLNLLLSLLNSKGVCLIVDSCFSGGFNDPPYFTNFIRNKRGFPHMDNNQVSASEWMEEFAEDLRGNGRVVLMSCREDEVSYGSVFTKCLIESLRGYADANEDGLVSAEEAFVYVEENIDSSKMHPTIFDNYPGELPLTEVELPPTVPETPTGQILGDTNTSYDYSTVSIDPEGGKICFGWDWDSDHTVDEWTNPVGSNTTIITSHSWEDEGTYNLRVRAKDENGLLSGWSNHIVVSMSSENVPDQRQTIIDKGAIFSDYWIAQGFVPSMYSLSKVELVMSSYGPGDPKPITIYIRDNLSGDNLAETSQVIPNKNIWHTLDFKDIEVIPGKTYFIVCKGVVDWVFVWRWKEGDPYPLGKSYHSEDGKNWSTIYPSTDFCFVTWAKI
ncbi:MAG: caspase family protein [Candidatus Hodarchaeota archaeon]